MDDIPNPRRRIGKAAYGIHSRLLCPKIRRGHDEIRPFRYLQGQGLGLFQPQFGQGNTFVIVRRFTGIGNAFTMRMSISSS